jgi:hypothetical protein
VLRITLPTREDDPLFILEGRLAGKWVEELIRVIHQIRSGKKCVFDIENVFYVDSLGEEALLWMNRMGATFITENAYGRDLCQRLHLCRTTVAKVGAPSSPEHPSGMAPRDDLTPLSKPRGSPS